MWLFISYIVYAAVPKAECIIGSNWKLMPCENYQQNISNQNPSLFFFYHTINCPHFINLIQIGLWQIPHSYYNIQIQSGHLRGQVYQWEEENVYTKKLFTIFLKLFLHFNYFVLFVTFNTSRFYRGKIFKKIMNLAFQNT